MPLTAEDFEQIKQLHARYAHAIDFRDVDALVRCFTTDGRFESHDSAFEGTEDLRRFGVEAAEKSAGHVRHTVLYSLIDGDEKSARSVSYTMITRDFGPPEGKGQATHSNVLTGGLYADDLSKEDGRWRYRRRTFGHDGWPQTLARFGKPLGIEPVDASRMDTVDRSGMTALDYEAIRQLQARYCYTIDFADYDGLVRCFTPTGTFAGSATTDPLADRIQGADQLREFAINVGRTVRAHARHNCVNVLVEGDGQRAQVSSYAIIPVDFGTPRQPGQRDNAKVGTTGMYRDTVVKIDGRWLFETRTFRWDGWPEVMALINRPLQLAPF